MTSYTCSINHVFSFPDGNPLGFPDVTESFGLHVGCLWEFPCLDGSAKCDESKSMCVQVTKLRPKIYCFFKNLSINYL